MCILQTPTSEIPGAFLRIPHISDPPLLPHKECGPTVTPGTIVPRPALGQPVPPLEITPVRPPIHPFPERKPASTGNDVHPDGK